MTTRKCKTCRPRPRLDHAKLGGSVNKLETETNAEYCQRVADNIDKDELIRALIILLQTKTRREAWSVVSEATSNGSGVSSAIANKFGFKNDY